MCLHFKEFNSADWLEVSNKYHEKWNMPHVLGSVDGKHVAIECPDNAGSAFFNHKVNFISIQILRN